jgi:hypothetical protein
VRNGTLRARALTRPLLPAGPAGRVRGGLQVNGLTGSGRAILSGYGTLAMEEQVSLRRHEFIAVRINREFFGYIPSEAV